VWEKSAETIVVMMVGESRPQRRAEESRDGLAHRLGGEPKCGPQVKGHTVAVGHQTLSRARRPLPVTDGLFTRSVMLQLRLFSLYLSSHGRSG